MSTEFFNYIGTVIPNKWKTDYMNGCMNKVIAFLEKYQLKKDIFLKSGSTCVVWNYIDPKPIEGPTGPIIQMVIKLCTKRIKYFKSFPNVTVNEFKKLIGKQFHQMLLPINDVLYEDSNYFVYTQEKVRILNLPDVDVTVFNKILMVVKTMFNKNVLTCDLISSNFGWNHNQQLYLLDYHDMKPVTDFFRKDKWSKIVRCLLEYASYFLYKKGFEEYSGESFVQWKSEMTIVKKEFGVNYFPNYLVNLFRSFSSNHVSIIVDSINECQTTLRNHNDEMSMIPSVPKDIYVQHEDKKNIHECDMEDEPHKYLDEDKPHSHHKENKPHKHHKEDKPHNYHKEDKPHKHHKEDKPHKHHKEDKPHKHHKEDKPHKHHKEDKPHKHHKEDKPHKHHKEDKPHKHH